jgi:hypothetical protein
VPLQGPARPHPDAPDGEPHLLQPHANPGPHPRQRRRPEPRRGALLLQHLVDQVLRPEVPRLLRVHLLHLGVRERRRRPQQQHLRDRRRVVARQQRRRWRDEEDEEEIRRRLLCVSFLPLPVCPGTCAPAI